MIKLITRQTIFEQNKNIASTISSMQKFMLDEYSLPGTAPDCKPDMEKYDCLGLEKPKTVFYNTITTGYNHLKDFTEVLAFKALHLLQEIGIEEIQVISHLKMDLFGNRSNDYKPLKNAYSRLEEITGSKTYNEAFEFSLFELPVFITIFFWLERCDPKVPEYIYFTDKKGSFAFYLCKHGNLHTIEFQQDLLSNINLEDLGWSYPKNCYDYFTIDGAVEGRQR